MPSGLDPVHLLADGEPWADLHALAHEEQALRLARYCPEARPAVVVGDPTADRLLRSLPCREEYRAAVGTGPRQLVVLSSAWGPESLVARRPGLAAELLALLPHDAFQVALVLHPNAHSRTGGFTSPAGWPRRCARAWSRPARTRSGPRCWSPPTPWSPTTARPACTPPRWAARSSASTTAATN
nr:hypothetical protein [Streptomyces sp. GBA 94-10 4N24]